MLLGDMIAKITQVMGVPQCTPCKQRQAALNQWHAGLTGAPAVQQTGKAYVLEIRDGSVVTRR
jgi:hypothetical protein